MFFTAKELPPVSFEIYVGGEMPLIVSYLFSILNKETSKMSIPASTLYLESTFKKTVQADSGQRKCLLQ